MKLFRGFLSHQRPVLMLMLLGSLALHGTAFVVVGIVDGPNISGWQNRPRVHLMQPALESGDGRPDLYRLVDLMDPSLMSLPSTRGFSQRTWTRDYEVSMEPVEWDSPPSFLAMAARSTDRVLLVQPALSDALQQDVLKTGVTPTTAAAAARSAPVSQPENRSVMRFTGGLAGRTIAQHPALPSLPHLGGLRPTVVRVGVARDGLVRFATLERGSGEAAADLQAVELARQARFASLPTTGPDQVTWGVATFYWATNSAPAAGPFREGTNPVIRLDPGTALLLYLFAYLGLVIVCWARYEWRKSRSQSGSDSITSDATEENHGHVDRAKS